jgi:hypothetical protein
MLSFVKTSLPEFMFEFTKVIGDVFICDHRIHSPVLYLAGAPLRRMLVALTTLLRLTIGSRNTRVVVVLNVQVYAGFESKGRIK